MTTRAAEHRFCIRADRVAGEAGAPVHVWSADALRGAANTGTAISQVRRAWSFNAVALSPTTTDWHDRLGLVIFAPLDRRRQALLYLADMKAFRLSSAASDAHSRGELKSPARSHHCRTTHSDSSFCDCALKNATPRVFAEAHAKSLTSALSCRVTNR